MAVARRNEVVVVALDKRYKELKKDLKGAAEKALLFLKQNGVAVEVYLVGGIKMKQLNRRHRGEDKVTNVLSFAAPKIFPNIPPRHLGEIYLCPPYIQRTGENIELLLTHGILHLLGFNHGSLDDRMTMEKMERKLMGWLNH